MIIAPPPWLSRVFGDHTGQGLVTDKHRFSNEPMRWISRSGTLPHGNGHANLRAQSAETLLFGNGVSHKLTRSPREFPAAQRHTAAPHAGDGVTERGLRGVASPVSMRDRQPALAQTEVQQKHAANPGISRGKEARVLRKIIPDVMPDQKPVHLPGSATVRAAARISPPTCTPTRPPGPV